MPEIQSLQQKADLSLMVERERQKLQTWTSRLGPSQTTGAQSSSLTTQVLLGSPVLPCTHMTKGKGTELGEKKSRKGRHVEVRAPSSQAPRVTGSTDQ